MAQAAEATPVRRPKVSTFALTGMAAIGAGALAAIFAYIFLVLTIPFDARLWWAGITSWAFALAFHLASAAEGGRRIAHRLAGGFFLIGAGSFYGSIALNAHPVTTKLVWFLVLSGIAVAVLVAIFSMARGSEADAERRARRKVTP